MQFLVKLIEVFETSCGDARVSLTNNCTHVANDLWLFEGDEIGLHEGISFNVLDEQPIGSMGDMSGTQISEMVSETFTFDVEEFDEKLILGDMLAEPSPYDENRPPVFTSTIDGMYNVNGKDIEMQAGDRLYLNNV